MKKMSTIVSSVVLALSLVACGSSLTNTSDKSETVKENKSIPVETRKVLNDSLSESTIPVETERPEEDSPYYFKDSEIVTKDYTIMITDWKVIPVGEAGNEYGDTPVIAFWYDTTNTSGKKIDPMTAWIYIMSAVQDNDPNAVNELNTGMLPDSRFTESQLQKIKEGGTVSNAMAYELTDTTTPVELTATNGMLGDTIGTMTFDITSGDTSNGSSASIGTVDNVNEEVVSFSNGRIVTDDYTIEITDYKVIPVGETGNEYGDTPIIAFWYNTTNTSGKKIDPMTAWIYIMSAVQDNDPNAVNELNTGMLPDSRFRESQLADIKTGGTVENAMAYELTDTTTPVELTATNGMFGEKLGSQTFEIK